MSGGRRRELQRDRTTGSSPATRAATRRRGRRHRRRRPTAEGGALRSQSPRRPAGEPRRLDGTILRVDPGTGDGLPGNPLAASSRRQRAPRSSPTACATRSASPVRPGTSELWIGDVGWDNVEEIDRLVDPTASPVANFGWPCYEGADPQPSYQAAGLNICKGLYAAVGRGRPPPFFSYQHSAKVVPGESCPTGSSSITRPRLLHRRPLSAATTTGRCSSPTTRATASG